MTHAYLQQLCGSSIRPHGKEFQAKILEINIALDLEIPLKHSFLLWWRCDGVCRTKRFYYYGYVSGVDEKIVFGANPQAVEEHAKFCGGKFFPTEEPNSEILSELREIKRKRKSMTKEIHQILVGSNSRVKRCKEQFDENATLKRIKLTKYSTDSGEE